MTGFKDNWFKWLRESTEGLLLEGVADIGLPERILDQLMSGMYNASEKAKMYMGTNWKKTPPNSRPYEVDYVTTEFTENYFADRSDLNNEIQSIRDALKDNTEGGNGRLEKKFKKVRKSLTRKVGAESEKGQEAVNKFMEFLDQQVFTRSWRRSTVALLNGSTSIRLTTSL